MGRSLISAKGTQPEEGFVSTARVNKHSEVCLEASCCQNCATVSFPAAEGCSRCGLEDVAPIELPRRGHVWGFTIQRFPPKSPPFVPNADRFVPFAVGYVELTDTLKIEAILECIDFGELEDNADVELIRTEPVPRFATSAYLKRGP